MLKKVIPMFFFASKVKSQHSTSCIPLQKMVTALAGAKHASGLSALRAKGEISQGFETPQVPFPSKNVGKPQRTKLHDV